VTWVERQHFQSDCDAAATHSPGPHSVRAGVIVGDLLETDGAPEPIKGETSYRHSTLLLALSGQLKLSKTALARTGIFVRVRKVRFLRHVRAVLMVRWRQTSLLIAIVAAFSWSIS